jgi:hypothetical protein
MKSKIQQLEKQKSHDSANQEMENRMKEERDSDIKKLTGNRPPSSF